MSPETLLHTIPIYTPPAIDKAFSVSYSSYLSNNCAALCYPLTFDYPIIPFVIENSNCVSSSIPLVTPTGGYLPYYDHIVFSRKVQSFDKSQLERLGSKYLLHGNYEALDIYYSERYSTLTVSGSPALFYKGHNLSFTQKEFEISADQISTTLDLDVREFGVKEFEVARLFKTEYPVKEYQNNLLSLKGFERVQSRNTLYFNQYTRGGKKDIVLRIYGTELNCKAKKMTLIEDFLKVETKYFNPGRHFGTISLQELMTDNTYITKSHIAMKHYYDQIQKGVIVDLPGKPSTTDLLTALLVRELPEPMKGLNQLLNSTDLNTKAKSKRRLRIKSILSRVSTVKDKYTLKF